VQWFKAGGADIQPPDDYGFDPVCRPPISISSRLETVISIQSFLFSACHWNHELVNKVDRHVYKSENALGCEWSDTPMIQQTCTELMRSQTPLPKTEAVNIFEVIMMKSAFVDWLKEKGRVHHSNYSVLFDKGALESLMQFLARHVICRQLIT
jgi:hypothetical protein